MTKPPIGASVPGRKAIQDRIKDEMAGIKQGKADLHPRGLTPEEPEDIPELGDLGLPRKVRLDLERLTSHNADILKETLEVIEAASFGHAELGMVERATKKSRDARTKDLKQLLAEHVPADETPKVYILGCRATRFTQNRESFSKDVARDLLLSLGVAPDKITKAFTAATTITVVDTLKISPPGEMD